ncbi:DUF4365 domain-containing protein [Acinetobacter silvestris]|uniref:DUF4365 domain-containing protein n=1 Tax=Acinetobacter silvestris TaxID=1977882 RepID=A0A1Y3CEK7_9GAMM|nr:DUF4365 domain-containing protein [Acinetobacter silvestris]OTG64786.1 DUF4365 domain-containing protein [Acinetobacter silvestris]
MRDLGKLSEYAFASWCAQVGLIANGSMIDKTGWDFYVEFPISQDISIKELHKPAFECKVQVKATDKKDRKLAITVSNLRRMATAPMPSFYIFLEFDGKNEVQRVFLVHMNNDLVYKILKKIREIEQGDKNKNLSKRTMTLHYGEENELNILDGKSLQNTLFHHIGESYSDYVTDKNKYLKECGFEDGYGKMKFSIAGENAGLHQLIDLSLGLTDEVDVQNLVNIDERFGIPSKNPNFELNEAKLKIELQPPKKGKISFKEDTLSRSLTFDINFYNSPFSFYDYRKYTKFRIIGDFFDITFEPYAGKSNYNFTLGGDKRLEFRKLEDALALISLISLISRNNQPAIVELNIENLEPLVFNFKSKFVKRNIEIFDDIINNVLKICQKFEIYEDIYVSLNELYVKKQQIEQFHTIITKTVECDFRVDLELSSNHIFEFEQAVSISVLCCQVGSHIIGAIVTVFGKPEEISKNKFSIDKADLKIEKTFSYTLDTLIKNNDILKSIESISSKYIDKYDVFYNWG